MYDEPSRLWPCRRTSLKPRCVRGSAGGVSAQRNTQHAPHPRLASRIIPARTCGSASIAQARVICLRFWRRQGTLSGAKKGDLDRGRSRLGRRGAASGNLCPATTRRPSTPRRATTGDQGPSASEPATTSAMARCAPCRQLDRRHLMAAQHQCGCGIGDALTPSLCVTHPSVSWSVGTVARAPIMSLHTAAPTRRARPPPPARAGPRQGQHCARPNCAPLHSGWHVCRRR